MAETAPKPEDDPDSEPWRLSHEAWPGADDVMARVVKAARFNLDVTMPGIKDLVRFQMPTIAAKPHLGALDLQKSWFPVHEQLVGAMKADPFSIGRHLDVTVPGIKDLVRFQMPTIATKPHLGALDLPHSWWANQLPTMPMKGYLSTLASNWGHFSVAQYLDDVFGRGRAFETLREVLRTVGLPSNLRRIPAITSDDVLDFTLTHGISLYLVPRSAIARRFIDASDKGGVRAVLDDRARIVEDCRAVLAQCDSQSTMQLRKLAEQAADALDQGLHGPSQAQSAALIDALVQLHIKPLAGGGRLRHKGETIEDAKQRFAQHDAWLTYITAALWASWEEFWVDRGDVVPRTFSRNATVHAPGHRQYSRRNATQALMTTTSTIGYLNGLT